MSKRLFLAIISVIVATEASASDPLKVLNNGTASALLCQGDQRTICQGETCLLDELKTSLSVDLIHSKVDYCIGEGCYSAEPKMESGSDGAISFAFHGQHLVNKDAFFDALATLHAGRKAATIGQFSADGSVTFMPMKCAPL